MTPRDASRPPSRDRAKPGGAGAAGVGGGGGGGGKARTAEERRAKAQALRNAQIRKDRRRRLLIGAVVVVVVAGAVTGGVFAVAGRDDGNGGGVSSADQVVPAVITSSDGPAVTEKTLTTVADTSGIDGVVAYDTAGYPATTGDPTKAVEHQHVPGPVTYALTPPVGGPHNAIWMNAGVYTSPVPTERGVHDMEHGAVWITYSPSLPAAQVAALTAFVGRQSMIAEASESAVSGQQNRYMVMSPWASDSLPAPIVLSAWGHQLQVQSASDPRLQRFVDTFRHSQTYTPEFGAAVDGIPTGTGGVPATDGSLKANPGGVVPAGSS